MKTTVAIIGAGPSGLLLSQLLATRGIDSIVLERQSKTHVLGRIRAGVLESGTVDLLRQAGCADRLTREGQVHDGVVLADGDTQFRINFADHIDRPVVVYGQTEVTRDLFDARAASGGHLIFEVGNVVIHDAKTDAPYVTFEKDGKSDRIDCAYVAGCDGFHGVSRKTIPADIRREYEKTYPFGWLGVLSETPPVHDELIYASSDTGFALCSMRHATLSRYYIQCDINDRAEDWTDDAFWAALKQNLPPETATKLITGPSIEKSIAPLRSFVTEPMQWGRLFLCGDAAHIVPPTGAKGLNTAASDVHYLFHALQDQILNSNSHALDRYSETALARVWKAERFSWWLTSLMHQFPQQSAFDQRMRRAELDFLRSNTAAQSVFAQNYVGLPY